MAKRLITTLVALSWGAWLWGQQSLDDPEARRELDTMARVLATTLKYVVEETNELPDMSWRYRSIERHLLYGQGAVFVIPMPSVRIGRGSSIVLGADGDYISVAKAQADSKRVIQETQSKPEKKPLSREELRAKQEEVKQQRRQSQVRRQEFEEQFKVVAEYLVEALAEHGNSLKSVQSDQYINLVFNGGSASPFFLTVESGYSYSLDGSNRDTTRIITVRKSWIDDYKAGRLTLDQFKQKTVHY